ncbi:MAG: hypothetical protein V2I45_06230 [Halieaceae bacterium]|nr:hypothetical protein [Halieaceae bacterium]
MPKLTAKPITATAKFDDRDSTHVEQETVGHSLRFGKLAPTRFNAFSHRIGQHLDAVRTENCPYSS